jgi:mRNA interferase RelE/StbE
MCQILLSAESQKGLRHIPQDIQGKIKEKLRQLSSNPKLGKPLRGNLRGRFSVRVGDYRAVYLIIPKNKQVMVIYVRHRKDAY